MNDSKNGSANRLAKRIQATLAGKASGQVTVKVTLSGTAAEAWRDLVKDAEGLGLDAKGIFVALLDAGAVPLRKALRAIPRG